MRAVQPDPSEKRPPGRGESREAPPPAPGPTSRRGPSWWGIAISAGVFAAVVGLAVGGTLWMMNHPDTAAARLFRKAAELSLQPESRASEEYLVFMGKDSAEHRDQLLSTSAAMRFVAESVLPNVVVVAITGNAEPTLQRIRELDFVRMAFQYDPVFACH